MAGDCSFSIVYDDTPPRYTRGARLVLDAAQSLLQLFGELEREKTGRPPQLVWDMNVYSFADRAILEFNIVGTKKEGRALLKTITPEQIAAALDISPEGGA